MSPTDPPPQQAPTTRADRWLWAVRLFKTRSLAAAACSKGQVSISGRTLKPSSPIRLGHVIQIRASQLTRTVEVIATLERRVAAKEVPTYCLDLTAPEAYEIAAQSRRERHESGPSMGTKPDKHQRRQLDRMLGLEPPYLPGNSSNGMP
jgi:ribosome-associated heat shock protein Hsp15